MRRPIYVVDSFSSRAFAGNPAGVLLDGTGLPDAQLQQIASEMRHSETAFILPSRDPHASFHLRWLTPKAEVRFCGHATLAALAVMADEAKRIRVPEKGLVRCAFTCKAGLLRAELSRDENKRLRIRFETPGVSFEQTAVSERLIAALGLVPEVLDPTFAPRRALIAEGVEGNIYIALRDRDALSRARCDPPALHDALEQAKAHGAVLFVRAPEEGPEGQPEGRIDAALRCFFPAHLGDSGEDPVTGSACGQLACLLQDVLPEILPRSLVFTQGDEVGRPGRVEIDVRPEPQPGVVRAWIGGAFTVVLRGELELR
jgi:PhzF family phenazine biosynthesis protein